MNWNPYKRIAELEAMHMKNIAVLDTLAHKLNDLNDRHKALHNRVVPNPYAAAPVRSEGEPVFTMFTKAEVASEAEQRRLKQREYKRAWYAKQKAKTKKAAAAAALAVGGTE